MSIIGQLFTSATDLNRALVALEEAGFHKFTVFGPNALFTAPETSAETEDNLSEQTHTAAGTVSGIAVNPRPYSPESPTARPVVDDLTDMGISQKEAETYAAGLQQNRTLLLVQTGDGRDDQARQIMADHA